MFECKGPTEKQKKLLREAIDYQDFKLKNLSKAYQQNPPSPRIKKIEEIEEKIQYLLNAGNDGQDFESAIKRWKIELMILDTEFK